MVERRSLFVGRDRRVEPLAARRPARSHIVEEPAEVRVGRERRGVSTGRRRAGRRQALPRRGDACVQPQEQAPQIGGRTEESEPEQGSQRHLRVEQVGANVVPTLRYGEREVEQGGLWPGEWARRGVGSAEDAAARPLGAELCGGGAQLVETARAADEQRTFVRPRQLGSRSGLVSTLGRVDLEHDGHSEQVGDGREGRDPGDARVEAHTEQRGGEPARAQAADGALEQALERRAVFVANRHDGGPLRAVGAPREEPTRLTQQRREAGTRARQDHAGGGAAAQIDDAGVTSGRGTRVR